MASVPHALRYANTFKKWLQMTHRYLALVLNLGFLSWFLSGFVMMYRDFPALNLDRSLALHRPLSSEAIRLSPQRAMESSGLEAPLLSVRVDMVSNRPVYRFQNMQGQTGTVYADTGEPLVMDAALARRIATECLQQPASVAGVEQMTERDQWTPSADYMEHMPMYRVQMNDAARTVLYVSSPTGEIVQMLNAQDKFWAWLGPIPHWMYFRDLRIRSNLWRQVVLWGSALGVVVCLTGILQGIIRYERRKRFPAFSPYSKWWFRWHHYTGFIFGIFVLTWVFSGLLSMNPLRWVPERSLSDQENIQWQGSALDLQTLERSPAQAVEILSAGHGPIRELCLKEFQAHPCYLAYFSEAKTLLLPADTAASEPLIRFSEAELLAAVASINPAPIAEHRLLTEYDAYYYAKFKDQPLPVFRVKMKDASETWYYIDPRTGSVVDKYQTLSRLNRWVYHGLHSLDFPQIYFQRPLWDVIVILLMTGGLSVSLTGVILFIRWMKRNASSVIGKDHFHHTEN